MSSEVRQKMGGREPKEEMSHAKGQWERKGEKESGREGNGERDGRKNLSHLCPRTE